MNRDPALCTRPLQCSVDNCATYKENTCECTACAAKFKLADNQCTEVRALHICGLQHTSAHLQRATFLSTA